MLIHFSKAGRLVDCRSMNMEEFKFIYWMEYAHRMWGRLLGVVFAGPALFFAASGYINKPLGRRLGLLFLMGGTQGLVGWWMVRSGLKVRADCHCSLFARIHAIAQRFRHLALFLSFES